MGLGAAAKASARSAASSASRRRRTCAVLTSLIAALALTLLGLTLRATWRQRGLQRALIPAVAPSVVHSVTPQAASSSSAHSVITQTASSSSAHSVITLTASSSSAHSLTPHIASSATHSVISQAMSSSPVCRPAMKSTLQKLWLSSNTLQAAAASRHAVDGSTTPAASSVSETNTVRRTAICLIGGARSFELTGVSLRRHLLTAYPPADAFVVANYDKDAHKLTLLLPDGHDSNATESMLETESQSQSHSELGRGARLVYVSVEKQWPLQERDLPTQFLSVPHLQGQLQQFLKQEACADVITQHERALSFEYDWVVWTRLDSYWHAPPPPLQSLDLSAYHVPTEFSWGGLNDRFGMGPRRLALPALRRLSALHLIAQHLNSSGGSGGLNSEKALKLQLQLQNVTVALTPLPFCILGFKRIHSKSYKFANIWGGDARDGRSCRPCARHEAGQCDPRTGQEPGWDSDYAAGASPWEKEAVHYLRTRGRRQCVRDWNRLADAACVWRSPPKQGVCRYAR